MCFTEMNLKLLTPRKTANNTKYNQLQAKLRTGSSSKFCFRIRDHDVGQGIRLTFQEYLRLICQYLSFIASA